MHVIGISAYYHDSACALITDGVIVAAAQEERFTRIKHDCRFPHHALEFCLDFAGLTLAEIDCIVYYEKPFLKFERLLETSLAFAPRGLRQFAAAMPIWLKEKLFLRKALHNELSLHSVTAVAPERLLFSGHHLSHAAGAFYPSPFADAAILTMDGCGEWTTTSVAVGSGDRIETLREIGFPHSLGLLYSAFTAYCGFKVNSGEYKLMGLAPYGRPVYEQQILDHLLDLRADGSFRLNMDYFDFCTGLTMFNSRFSSLFNGRPRSSDNELTGHHLDMAASIQAVTEKVVLVMAADIAKTTGQKNLCLAGGVALNCVANGKLLRSGLFDSIWIQPASGDAGGALGAALAAYHLHGLAPRMVPLAFDGMNGAYLGPAWSDDAIETQLLAAGAVFERMTEEQLIDKTVLDLADGRAVGWFQGRMEFGPRALGSRSILADPRSPLIQKQLNLKVKFRESFRPFAPAILRDDLEEWFELATDSPYMLLCADILQQRRCAANDKPPQTISDRLQEIRSELPAVTHIDYSARLQTVHEQTNPLFHRLITAFKAVTGCPVLVNTSFNVRGEPIVCTPTDAFTCFMGTDIDSLAIGGFYLVKSRQQRQLLHNYAVSFSPD